MKTDPRWVFPYSQAQRRLWQSGKLVTEWAGRYPFFDPRDVQNTEKQPDSHFFEWLAAILIYEATGWLSLIEKYDLKGYHRKLRILKEIMTEKQILALDRENRPCLPPDLLVYKPNMKDFFFCEVKGPSDRWRKTQLEFFPKLERNVGKDIYLAKFKGM